MFGHQDDTPTDDQAIPDASIDAVVADQPIENGDQPAAPVETPAEQDTPDAPEVPEWQHPGVPVDTPEEPSAPQPISDIISPAGGFPKAPAFPTINDDTPYTPAPDHAPATDETTHELIDIKQHALTELTPLIDELDQAPEERFRTIMMMIQASDDQALVKKAYEAAHAIEDEKARAQALLDIVNEINYFTQPQ